MNDVFEKNVQWFLQKNVSLAFHCYAYWTVSSYAKTSNAIFKEVTWNKVQLINCVYLTKSYIHLVYDYTKMFLN